MTGAGIFAMVIWGTAALWRLYSDKPIEALLCCVMLQLVIIADLLHRMARKAGA